MKETLTKKLTEYLINNAQPLKQIYEEFSEEKKTTIRGRLNENLNRCFKRLGKGIYVSIIENYLATGKKSKALIIVGDCWEEIQNIEDNSIDAIITDSPYTSLDKHYTIGTTRKRNLNKSIGFKTRDIDTTLLKELYRVLKKGGHFFNFLPADAQDTRDQNDLFIYKAQNVGFVFNKRFIWDKKCIAMGYNGRNRYEQIIFLSKGKRTMPRDRSIPDLLSYKRISPSKRIHVAQKPNELIKDLIKFSTIEGDTLLDIFAGSLVLAEESLNLNRNSISIESDSEMVKKSIQLRKLNMEVMP